jgi:hypothetical protein
MRSWQSAILLAVAALIAACSATSPDWWRGDPNYTPPGINNNG